MAAGHVPTTNLLAFYANTTPDVVISSTDIDAAVVDIVATLNSNYDAYTTLAATGGIGTINLADLSVTTAKLALLAVTSAQIALSTITAAQLADGAVTSAKILDETIVNADINAGAAIAGSKLADGGITTAKIADLNVTAAKIALLAITAAQIADLTITSGKLALLAVGTGQIADGAVTSLKIANDTILDADINSAAAIAWSKISKTSSSLTDLATRLITDLTGVLAAAQFPALTGDITTVAGALGTSLSVTGVAAGTYNNVTVDAKGRVTFGSLLTATSLIDGFMSATAYNYLYGLTPSGLGSFAVPADVYITYGNRFKVGLNSTTDTLDTYET